MSKKRLLSFGLAWIGGVALIMMAVFILQVQSVTSQEADDSVREADAAKAAEQEGLVESQAIVNPNFDRGGTFPLFMGVDDTAIPAYVMDPTTNVSMTAFLGTNVWSAAYDPGNDRVLFTNGVTLHEWPVGGVVNTLGAVNNGAGNNLSIVGMAFYDGTLYGYTASVTEGIWIIDPATQIATLHIATVAADTDCGGLAADPSDGTFYCTSDDTSGPGGSGLYIVNGDGSLTFVTSYPAGETDVDGLTVGTDGRAYLITDDDTPQEIYVYDLVGATYLPSLVNPWPVGDQLFSAGAWIEATDGPGISLQKTVGTDLNTCAATDVISVTQGTQVTYCYEVTNTGTISLDFHDLDDSELGTILSGFSFELGPGASVFVTDTDNIFADTTNVATWTACNVQINAPSEGFDCGGPFAIDVVSDTAQATVNIIPPSIALAKTVGTDPNVCAGTSSISVDPGTDVTYCYEVTNTGPYTLSVHDLDDSELGTILTGFPFDLDPGASAFVTQTANIVTDTTNVATWTACNIDGPPSNTCFGPATFDVVSATASADVMVVTAAPDITVDPASLAATLATDMQSTQVLTIGNVGDSNLLWTIDEETAVTAPTAPPAPLTPPTNGPVVESPADCALYENYAGAEPEGYAEYCGSGVVLQPWTSEQFDPTDTGYALDLRFDGFVSHVLNDFAGQTVLGTNAQSIFAMDFDETGTILYALDNASRELGTLNLANGTFTPIAVVSGIPAADTLGGLTIDPSNGTAYVAALTTGVQMTLYTMDLGTAVATSIGSDPSVPLMIDIAIGPQGIMYGHEIGTDMIYTINTSTGAATAVGLTGVNSNFAQGMDFDNADGTLYAYTYQGTGANQYGTIDLATGALTPLSIDNPLGEFEGATQTAIGGCSPSDLPWLSVSPASGTTAPAGSDSVDVTFDSTGLAPNVYTGNLCVASNDPDEPVVRVPVMLTVLDAPPAPGLVLTKTVGVDNSVCATTDTLDVTTGADVYYCYTIENTGDITFTTHDLVDDQLGTLLSGFAQDVGPGEVFSFYPVTATITGTVTNIADWTAYVDTALFVTATDSATVTANDPTDVSLNSFTGGSNTAALPMMVGLLAVLVLGVGFFLRRMQPISKQD